MELSRLKELAAGGKIFSVLFTKRTDGTDRRMVCRTGVYKDLTGMDRPWDPEERGLLTVYDMQKKGYRYDTGRRCARDQSEKADPQILGVSPPSKELAK